MCRQVHGMRFHIDYIINIINVIRVRNQRNTVSGVRGERFFWLLHFLLIEHERRMFSAIFVFAELNWMADNHCSAKHNGARSR